MNASRLLAPLLLLATLGLAPAPALADPLAEAAHDFCLKMQDQNFFLKPLMNFLKTTL